MARICRLAGADMIAILARRKAPGKVNLARDGRTSTLR
jgi:hypothetical protein